MTRVAAGSSFNPSDCAVEEGDGEDTPGCGDDEGEGRAGGEAVGEGIRAGMGAGGLAEERRAGGEGCWRNNVARDSGSSHHESAADVKRGLHGLLPQCGATRRQADSTGCEGSSGAEGAEGAVGGKATAEGAPLKRSLTADATGTTMARGAPKGMGGPSMRAASVAETSLRRSLSDVLLQDAEMDEMDSEVLQEAFTRVVALQQRVQHYRDLGGFALLMALFTTILYLQADSSRSYEITAAHSVLFPPGMSQDSSNTFAGPADFYDWLNSTIVQTLWADLPCGDGTCDRPFQFPAFGRFGCHADCGTFPNLTAVIINFSSQLDTQGAAEEPSWNLCMVNPVSLCWYEAFQPVAGGEVAVEMEIPDGDWEVLLNAPSGGIRGAVHAPPPGTRRLSVIGAASTVELVAWGDCASGDAVDANAANQKGASGGSSAAADVCRNQRAGGHSQREVAGAFVDCVRMCVVAPSTITRYAGTPCSTPDIATVFSNTPCNTSGATPSTPKAPTNRRKALYHLHHSHSHGHWATLGAAGLSDAASLPAAAAVRAPSASAAGASASATALAATHMQGAQKIEVTPAPAPPPPPPPPSPLASPASSSLPPHAAAAAAAEAMAAGGSESTSVATAPSLWSLLGATDRQRLTVLQVAISRALFTMAKDTCLAGRAPGAQATHAQGGPGSMRRRIVACLCTMLGGPVTAMEECRLMDEARQQVVAAADLYAYLQRTHISGGSSGGGGGSGGGGSMMQQRAISAQHMRRFVQTLVAALRSVTPMSDDSTTRLHVLLHAFDDAIVSSHAVGCSQGALGGLVVAVVSACCVASACAGGAWLQWRAGVTHNTTIHVGDKVTWVWDDDLPHSLKVAGMGEAGDPFFLGFGGHRLAVSRQLACTPMNAGVQDAGIEPLPPTCFSIVTPILPPTLLSPPLLPHLYPPGMDGEPADWFAYSKRLANGVCDAPCNTPACAFDGGDCACVDPLFGPGICTCPPGHTRRDDGCQSSPPLPPNTSVLRFPAPAPCFPLRPLDSSSPSPLLNPCTHSPPSPLMSCPLLSSPACCASTAVGRDLTFPFSLQRYGPNYTDSNHAFAAEREIAVNRFVSRHNRLLIGMVLQQERWGTQVCSGQGVLHLAGWCSNGTSREPYGVNPHFLPTSSLYDGAAAANMSQLDNHTFGVKLQFNPQGLPYGFIRPTDSIAAYPLVFDINLDNDAATRRLQYLVDGNYIDNATRSVQVSSVTFNGEARTFVLTTVRCTVDTGGSMAVTL
ncbi:unnamed protein product [Closterium sp. Naga37s-1]|nr:unnamed protein product [Closterium sp. Naga37s-1]